MPRPLFIIFSVLIAGQLLIFSFLHFLDLQSSTSHVHPAELLNGTQISENEGQVETWSLTRESMLSDNGSMSKQRQDFLLLVRKVVLFSVREINRRVSGEECGHWWVNPLSVQTFEKRVIHPGVLTYGLTFQIQPGNIPFETNVLAVKHGGDHVSSGTHLEYLGGSRLDQLPRNCGTVRDSLRNVCLCPGEVAEAEKVTSLLREEWDKTDPELLPWPPNVPMFVSDYITLGDARLYVKTPSNKTVYCDPTVKMIIFINSPPSHTLHRKTIRKTFGNPEFLHPIGVRLLFILGTITNQTLQKEIDEEFNLYDDMVQADHADSYHNMSLSHLSLYNWVVTRCNNGKVMPKWVLKADDDYFLNPSLALRVAKENPDFEFVGNLVCDTKAIRDLAYINTHYMPRYMYAPDSYVRHLSGVAYMVQTKAFKRILAATNNVPLIHLDDSYVMGLLTKEAEIRPAKSNAFAPGRTDPDACNSKLMLCSYVLDSSDMELQWKSFSESVEDPEQCELHQNLLKGVPFSTDTNKQCFQ